MKAVGLTVVATAACAAAASLPASGASFGSIYPEGGLWHGHDAHGQHRLSFKVTSDGKHAYGFVVRLPYTCADGTPSGLLTFTLSGRHKIQAFDGSFNVTYYNLSSPGLSNDIDFYMTGKFSHVGKRATRVSGGVSTSFDTLKGDVCNDRFDSWKAAR
jgi:hypothetical protein